MHTYRTVSPVTCCVDQPPSLQQAPAPVDDPAGFTLTTTELEQLGVWVSVAGWMCVTGADGKSAAALSCPVSMWVPYVCEYVAMYAHPLAAFFPQMYRMCALMCAVCVWGGGDWGGGRGNGVPHQLEPSGWLHMYPHLWTSAIPPLTGLIPQVGLPWLLVAC